MRRNCEACDEPFTARQPNARFCGEACRKRASRGSTAVRTGPIQADSSSSAAISARSHVLATLEAAGRAETWEGACALALAERIDAATAVMGYAALIKQLGETMDRALDGVRQSVDPVADLKAKVRSLRAVQ